jgi:outer membrane protein W
MLRTVTCIAALVLAVTVVPTPASAQIVQSVQVGFGGFFPLGQSARDKQDVLVADLQDQYALLFKISEFRTGNVNAEYQLAFGNHLEVSIGGGFQSGGTRSVYRDYEDDRDGTDIDQELHLRVVPVTGLVRFLGGRPGGTQPYFGVGVSALRYRYSEIGEFIDSSDGAIFPARYIARGTAVGPTVLAGVRVPIKGDIWGVSFEWRYQGGTGKTGGFDQGFLGEKIDLGGNNVNVGFMVRF